MGGIGGHMSGDSAGFSPMWPRFNPWIGRGHTLSEFVSNAVLSHAMRVFLWVLWFSSLTSKN